MKKDRFLIAEALALRVLRLNDLMEASSVGPLDKKTVELAKEFLKCPSES